MVGSIESAINDSAYKNNQINLGNDLKKEGGSAQGRAPTSNFNHLSDAAIMKYSSIIAQYQDEQRFRFLAAVFDNWYLKTTKTFQMLNIGATKSLKDIYRQEVERRLEEILKDSKLLHIIQESFNQQALMPSNAPDQTITILEFDDQYINHLFDYLWPLVEAKFNLYKMPMWTEDRKNRQDSRIFSKEVLLDDELTPQQKLLDEINQKFKYYFFDNTGSRFAYVYPEMPILFQSYTGLKIKAFNLVNSAENNFSEAELLPTPLQDFKDFVKDLIKQMALLNDCGCKATQKKCENCFETRYFLPCDERQGSGPILRIDSAVVEKYSREATNDIISKIRDTLIKFLPQPLKPHQTQQNPKIRDFLLFYDNDACKEKKKQKKVLEQKGAGSVQPPRYIQELCDEVQNLTQQIREQAEQKRKENEVLLAQKAQIEQAKKTAIFAKRMSVCIKHLLHTQCYDIPKFSFCENLKELLCWNVKVFLNVYHHLAHHASMNDFTLNLSSPKSLTYTGHSPSLSHKTHPKQGYVAARLAVACFAYVAEQLKAVLVILAAAYQQATTLLIAQTFYRKKSPSAAMPRQTSRPSRTSKPWFFSDAEPKGTTCRQAEYRQNEQYHLPRYVA